MYVSVVMQFRCMLYVVAGLLGVTQLDNMLYVVTENSSIIRTFSVNTLSSLGDIHVQGMEYPSDIVVCRHDRQLYVADYNCIWRVSADDHKKYKKWLPSRYTSWLPTMLTGRFRVDTLSVTSRGLLVTSRNPPSLREYSMTDRQLLRDVQLPGYVKYLYHGVETTRGTFVIGHCGTSQDVMQLAVSCHHINTLVLSHLTTFIILYTTDLY